MYIENGNATLNPFDQCLFRSVRRHVSVADLNCERVWQKLTEELGIICMLTERQEAGYPADPRLAEGDFNKHLGKLAAVVAAQFEECFRTIAFPEERDID